MRAVFVDTAHHVAIFYVRDELHLTSRRVMGALGDSVDFVTSEAVLTEFLASFSRRTQLRTDAAAYVDAVRMSMVVVPSTTALFEAGLDLYRRRPDKTYSMVDCMSMVLCRERDIQDILSADRDFEQEGFTLLLR